VVRADYMKVLHFCLKVVLLGQIGLTIDCVQVLSAGL